MNVQSFVNWIYGWPIWVNALIMIALPFGRALLGHKRRWPNILISALIIFVVVFITLINRGKQVYEPILIPFYTFIRAKEQKEYLRSMLMNIYLYEPLGLFLPFVFKKGQIWKSVLIAFLLSVFIEAMQYFLSAGLTEIDDVLSNTLGAFLGTTAFFILKLRQRILEHNFTE